VELGGKGEAQAQTMVALKNVAPGAVITRASAGNLRENTKIAMPGEAQPKASAAAKPASQ
jgi:hypothetical protein